MNQSSRAFHLASTILLALGFIGVAVFVWDANFATHDGGGANIGLAFITLICLIAGALGIVLGVVAIALALLNARGRTRAQ